MLSGREGNDTIRGQGILIGGAGSDWLEGSEQADHLYAEAMPDAVTNINHLFGFGGDDRLGGGHGVDILDGGAGYDVITGGSGDDIIYVSSGYDTIDGEGGNDTLSFSNLKQAVTVDFSVSSRQLIGAELRLSQVSNIESVKGTAYNDTMTAGNGVVTLIGGAGDDILYGNAEANQYIYQVGDGFDQITEAGGQDSITINVENYPQINYMNIDFIKDENNLIIQLEGENILQVNQWEQGDDQQVETITLSTNDNQFSIDTNSIDQLAQYMAAFTGSGSGTDKTVLDNAKTLSWQSIITAS